MAKKKKRIKRHKRIRVTCSLCGGNHSRSQHKSHGKGSFKKTHPKKRRRKRWANNLIDWKKFLLFLEKEELNHLLKHGEKPSKLSIRNNLAECSCPCHAAGADYCELCFSSCHEEEEIIPEWPDIGSKICFYCCC